MRAPTAKAAGHAIRRAASVNLAELFRQRAQAQPQAPALRDAVTTLSYAELAQRVRRLAAGLRAAGLRGGDRMALLSENRIEYIELELAAAEIGAVVACLNWRLADDELLHCIRLVAPAMVIVSPRHAATLARIDAGSAPTIALDSDAFERLRAAAPPAAVADDDPVDAEAGLVVLYTSGTTGLPKGALVSQRAMVARAQVFAADYGIGAREGFVAWSPLFHMAATDHALATLLLGGTVFVSDGLDLDRLCALLETQPLGWLLAMPGMIEPLIDALKAHHAPRIAPKMVGAMADLVPRHQLAELTGLLRAPYLNTFGSTETGLPPASASLLPPGEAPASLAKRQSSLCSTRLVDAEEREVGVDEPGEMMVRGPTLFSGYWNAENANAHDFRGGWFHLGDMFVRHADGTLDFVDRLKYLIKSGGENIYPAEIERVLLAHAAVADAAVVRKPDARWGEVPVAFVALKSPLDAAALTAWCRERLAHYKVPREFRFIELAALPRSGTGKIQRHEIERRMV
ncbi:MAG: AMP-binding protein [Nitrospira sp.]|nr:AMP-binding protein [Nitrospira sp.]